MYLVAVTCSNFLRPIFSTVGPGQCSVFICKLLMLSGVFSMLVYMAGNIIIDVCFLLFASILLLERECHCSFCILYFKYLFLYKLNAYC